MDTAEKIEPALTAEEWANRGDPVVDGYIDWDSPIVDVASHYSGDQSHRFIPGLIALANAALPDSDPRKITRERVAALRYFFDQFEWQDDEGSRGEGWQSDELATAVPLVRTLVAALESYLPPE